MSPICQTDQRPFKKMTLIVTYIRVNTKSAVSIAMRAAVTDTRPESMKHNIFFPASAIGPLLHKIANGRQMPE